MKRTSTLLLAGKYSDPETRELLAQSKTVTAETVLVYIKTLREAKQ
jgi:hypothetical protein